MDNTQIAQVFDEIADLLDLQGGNPFRIRSYRSAAQSVRGLSRRLEDLADEEVDLTEIPNIGKSTAEKVFEILETGTCQRIQQLRKQVPSGLTEVMHVPRIGPRQAMQLHKALQVDSLDDLRRACEKHRVQDLPGMGRKTEANILKGLKTLESTSGRILLKEATEPVEVLGRHLDQIQSIRQWMVAGSYRRGQETIGDLDILIQTNDRPQTTKAILKQRDIDEVISQGKERVSVRLSGGLQVDFRFFEAEAFGAALLYFTGSKAHNIALRKRVLKCKWKLNEYGLFQGKRRLEGKSEAAIYRRLKLAWIPPELRENRGEIEAAESQEIPRLIEQRDLRGDLHCHTKATDGAHSIQEMAQAARDLGYDYLAITDHSKAVTVAHGLNEGRLRRHADAIRKAGQSLKGFTLLAGVEVDILKDGKLDLKETVLAELDWVVASVHSHFNLSKKPMTDRLLAAITSGVVDCIGHPCGRLIGKRDPVALDTEKIFAACREHHVCLEINAQPDRLDLPDTFCQQARAAGVRFTIDTDAHKSSAFEMIRYGVLTARRGWLTRKDVLNTVSAKELRRRTKRT